MLSLEIRNELRLAIEQEQARLEHELGDLATRDAAGDIEAAYPESGGSSDEDNAAEITAYADEVSLVDRMKSELRDVHKALAAIKAGTYGTCRYCDTEIDLKRLRARPTSSSCIACKKQLTQEM